MTTNDAPTTINAGIESAALRKLVYQLAGYQPGEDTDTNVVQAAEEAIERMNELETRLSAIEGATGINMENAEYQQLSRPAKVKRVREKLKQKARETQNGRSAMDYNEIAALFDYHASPGHSVELAKAAAEYDEEHNTSNRAGYSYEKRSDGNNRVTVDLEKID